MVLKVEVMVKRNGFTLIELMVGVAMMGLLVMIGLPSFNEWIVRMRVDDEISQMHRLLLTARNTAVNMEQPVTICPLDGASQCTNDWTNEVTVFLDGNNNQTFEPANDEVMIRQKNEIADGDSLTFDRASIVYQPTGQSGGGNGTFRYCPLGFSDMNRGIIVSVRGRVYATTDTDNDDKDEDRNGNEIVCP